MTGPLYTRDGDLFAPTTAARSPWAEGAQHGSPPSGLLAMVLEELFVGSGLVPARITVDLFRQIPMKALRARGTVVRSGKRIGVGSASLRLDETELARATGLFLRPTESVTFQSDGAVPPGPEAIAEVPLVPEGMESRLPSGFHQQVETRRTRPPEGCPLAVWFRIPPALIESGATSTFQLATMCADYGNAMATMSHLELSGQVVPFINPDLTLTLERLPQGPWLCLVCERFGFDNGIGSVTVSHHDIHGRYGSSTQTRMANG